MSERRQDRFFAACGIASAMLVHVGLFVGLAGGQEGEHGQTRVQTHFHGA